MKWTVSRALWLLSPVVVLVIAQIGWELGGEIPAFRAWTVIFGVTYIGAVVTRILITRWRRV